MLRKFSVTALVAVGIVMLSAPADAAFKIRVSTDGGNTFQEIEDNQAGDNNTAANEINYNTVSFTNGLDHFTLTGGASLSITNGQTAVLTNQATVTRTGSGSAESIIIWATFTGYMMPTAAQALLSASSVTQGLLPGTLPDGAVEYQSFADPNNAEYGTTVSTALLGANDFDSIVFANMVPFSISSMMTFTSDVSSDTAQLNVTSSVSPVPEPGTMALLALGGLGLAGARVRRRRKASV